MAGESFKAFKIVPGYDLITERLTDEEILFFKEALYLCSSGDWIGSDYYVSKISSSMWPEIRKYRFMITQGGREDSE